jgi:glyoxylase-like metal-dependent hydrolase (beta-lactamase superfamily II)
MGRHGGGSHGKGSATTFLKFPLSTSLNPPQMNPHWPARLYCIRGLMGCCHLLEDDAASVMIDTGLVGEPFFIRRLIRRLGLKPDAIKAILLTHGHLDHAGNLAWLKSWTGAKVYAHAEELRHVAGTYPYAGVARWCGRLEAAGRFLFRYRAAPIDEFITDGQELPFWGGLRVIHLPGHTRGHCGFFSAKHDLLFSGDLLASYFFNTHQPPAILNSAPELLAASVAKVQQLAPRLIIPSHYDFCDGDRHRRRFYRLYGLPS